MENMVKELESELNENEVSDVYLNRVKTKLVGPKSQEVLDSNVVSCFAKVLLNRLGVLVGDKKSNKLKWSDEAEKMFSEKDEQSMNDCLEKMENNASAIIRKKFVDNKNTQEFGTALRMLHIEKPEEGMEVNEDEVEKISYEVLWMSMIQFKYEISRNISSSRDEEVSERLSLLAVKLLYRDQYEGLGDQDLLYKINAGLADSVDPRAIAIASLPETYWDFKNNPAN